MFDNKDPLSQLWQGQKVEQADLSAVSRKWINVRFKQRCYVILDFLSLLIPFTIIWYQAEKIDSYTMALVLGVMGISVLMVIYLTWLRRFSLGWSNVSTDQHIQQLQKQIQNNIKIANLSLHSVWFIVVLFVVFYANLYFLGVFSYEILLDKVLITLAINAVAMPAIWVWASRRKQRFCKELDELNHLLNGTKR